MSNRIFDYVIKVDYEEYQPDTYKGVVVFSKSKKKEITRFVSNNFRDDLLQAEKFVIKVKLLLYDASVEKYAKEIGILEQGACLWGGDG